MAVRGNRREEGMLPNFIERVAGGFRRPRVSAVAPDAIDPEEFRDFFRRDCFRSIIMVDGKRYYAKGCENESVAGKSLLAFGLLRRIMNVPEVLLPGDTLQARIGDMFGPRTWILVALCQDQDPQTLPIRSRTEAIAAELAFSTWINRRDAHNSNRCYRDGIPMFFDFDHAFVPNAGETEFFRFGPDPGYTPNWRLLIVEDDVAVETKAIRESERAGIHTLHPIHDREAFHRHLQAYADMIRGMSAATIASHVHRAFRQPDERGAMIEFLTKEQGLLSQKLVVVSEILSRPLPSAYATR